MDDEFAHLVPDEDEEIPETYEDTEDVPEESPLDVLRRCQENTDLEPFELLKLDAEKWLDGQQDSQALKQRWLALDQELASRHHYFQEGLRFQEWSEFLIVTGREVFEQFEWIQDQMQRFDLGLETSQELEVAYAIEQIYAALVVLQHAYKTLRELQDKLPAMSDSPLVAELIRVGQLAADEKIPIDSFLERLHVYQDMQERLRQALQLAQPAPREQAILDEERMHLDAAFETQQQGVEELLHFAETLDRLALERGLELLDQGAQVQLRLRQRLDKTDSTSCPFCSASNEVHSRFCSACSARLPSSTPADTTTPTASDGLSSHFQRLASAVQQRLRGQISEAEFQTTLGWFRGLYESVCRQRNAQPPAPANAPPDQKQLLAEAQESMQAGLELIGEGLEQLEAGEQLEDALETVIAGGDRLLELAHSLQER
ncbi:zinc ribbon domain-containing protein [bacterium]|nr:zinc ribbon domain-containing protein [bacterium]